MRRTNRPTLTTAGRRLFVAGSTLWAVLVPIAPFAASQPAPAPWWYALAFLTYGAGSVICHQLPERSFHLWSAQLPVCARCTGIYFGAAVSAIGATLGPRSFPRRWPSVKLDSAQRVRVLLGVMSAPTLMTLVYEWTAGEAPSNAIRAMSGVPFGVAIAASVIAGFSWSRVASPVNRRDGKVN